VTHLEELLLQEVTSNCHPLHRGVSSRLYKVCTALSLCSAFSLSSPHSLRVYMRHARMHNSSVLKCITYLWQKTPLSRSRSLFSSEHTCRCPSRIHMQEKHPAAYTCPVLRIKECHCSLNE